MLSYNSFTCVFLLTVDDLECSCLCDELFFGRNVARRSVVDPKILSKKWENYLSEPLYEIVLYNRLLERLKPSTDRIG